MQDNEFYAKYASMPVAERGILMDDEDGNPTTPNLIYNEVKDIDERIRPDIIRKEKLIRAFNRLEI